MEKAQQASSLAILGRKPSSNGVLSGSGFQVFSLILDICALFLAYHISLPVSAFLEKFLETDAFDLVYSESSYKHLVVAFILSFGSLVALFFGGHYTKRLPWWGQVHFLLKVTSFALLIEGFSAYILGLHYSRILIVIFWSLAFGALLLSRIFGYKIKSHAASWKLPTVIVGDVGTITDALFAMDSDRSMGLDPQVVLLRDKEAETLDREELPERYRHIRILDGLTGYQKFLETNPEFYYVIAMEAFRGDRRDSLIALLTQKNIRFSIIPSISRTSLYQSKPLYFFGNDVMMLESKGYIMTSLEAFMKRAMDIAGALVGLAVFGLPMLLVAVMLRVEGQGGTIFYGGERIGRNGRTFRCWKFRSMEPGTDHLLHQYLAENPQAKAYWDRYFKLPDDPRVQTRTSRFIRKASIDELPQLWNVLKGDMSLVGPRPILPNEIEAYGDKYHEYTAVRPGLTGLWQVSGRSATSFHRRVVWDSWYVRNWSLWGDVVIILKTVGTVLGRSGAS